MIFDRLRSRLRATSLALTLALFAILAGVGPGLAKRLILGENLRRMVERVRG